jgi:hypothetical protein
MTWLCAEPLDVLVLVAFFVGVCGLLLNYVFTPGKDTNAQDVDSCARVAATAPPTTPPPYLSAIGCTADSLESAGHHVTAEEHHGTTQLTLARVNGPPVPQERRLQ